MRQPLQQAARVRDQQALLRKPAFCAGAHDSNSVPLTVRNAFESTADRRHSEGQATGIPDLPSARIAGIWLSENRDCCTA